MADANSIPGPDSPVNAPPLSGPYGTVPVEESTKPNYPPPPTYVQEHPPSYTDVTDLHGKMRIFVHLFVIFGQKMKRLNIYSTAPFL